MKLSSGHIGMLELFWRQEAHSRSEAAKLLRLSRPTVSSLADDLLRGGMLLEHGPGESSGGKPPVLLGMNPAAFHTVGIDIGYENRARGLRLDAAGAIVERATAPIGNDFNSILQAIEQLASQLNASESAGVGIAVSGIVDSAQARIVNSANFDLTDKPLAEVVENKLARPVCIDNRSRMSARAEQFAGAAAGKSDFALISLGKSIGSAFYIGKQLYAGRHGASGEIRTLPVPGYDTAAGFQTLEETLREDIMHMYQVSPELAARHCAEGMRYLLAMFDLDLVVLSGRFEDLGEAFRKELAARLTPEFGCEIRPAAYGHFSAACGAAISVVQKQILTQKQEKGKTS